MRLFDTTFVIDLVAGDAGAGALARRVDDDGSFRAISVVTAHEYLRGVFWLHRATPEVLAQKLRAAEAELARFEIITYSLAVARVGARVDAELEAKGASLGFADAIIAATALHLGLTLVTRDMRAFRQVPSLPLETY